MHEVTVNDNDRAKLLAMAVDTLEVNYQWTTIEAVADVAEVTGTTKAEVVSALLFADRYTVGGFQI